MLNVGRSHGKMISAQAGIRAQLTGDLIRNKTGTQQSEGVKLLQPLAVGDIGFSSRKIFDLFAVDEGNSDPSPFEHIEESNPVDTGGFHSNRSDIVFFQIRDCFKIIIGEGAKGSDFLLL